MPGDVVLGRILGAFGVRGEVKLSLADPDALRAGLPVRLRLERGEEVGSVLESIRPHQRGFVARLRGCDDADAAKALRGAALVAARASLPQLPSGAYREADLVGMRVIDARLGRLGEVKEIRHYPSCDMLVLGPKPVLVPMLRAYLMEVDSATGTINVTLPDGFEELG